MDSLLADRNFEETLKTLSVPQMREICRQTNIEHTGNAHILRHRIRRRVQAKRDHDEMIRIRFPNLPPNLAQQSFELNSILEKFRASNTRSTINLENIPIENDPNISVIASASGLATDLAGLNTSFQAHYNSTAQAVGSSDP